MSTRVDSSSLIAGAVVVGDPGLGVLAELVPSTGEHGAGYLYDSLEFPADTGKEVRGLITTWPTLGTLTAFEDSSFEYDGVSDAFAFQMYVNGQPVGTPQTVTVTVGASAAIAPATGHIVARGYAPTVQQGDAQAIAPQTGHIQAQGYAPEISQAASIRPEPGHIVAQGYAPSIAQPRTLSPSTGRISARGYAPTVQQLSATYPITLAQVRLLYSIYRLHGLAEPLSISPTAREVASLLQSVSSVGASTTVETSSLPNDVPADPGLLIEELAALHGLTIPLTVAADSRTAGTIVQSFSVIGSSITVTRQ